MSLKKRCNIILISLLVVFAASCPAVAADDPKCKNNFPNLVSDINWRTFFPMRLGGNVIMNYGSMPDNVGTENTDDFNPNSVFCTCDDAITGYPRAGAYVSFWEPSRAIEVVQKDGCYPFLFGMDMGKGMSPFGAFGTGGQSNQAGAKAFYNIHYYAFPLLTVMDLISGLEWCTDWINDIDLLGMTEVDPGWNDDELTIFINPEAIMFGNPIAQALCAVDALASSAGFPLNALSWCAGSWGSLYPFTGNTGTVGSQVRTTSLLAGRLLARYARLPIYPAAEFDTSSAGAKCGGIVRPFLKKSQYKFSTIFPIPETEDRGGHVFGSSPFTWGEHRNIPGTGEYQIYMVWRKRNCCLKLI